MAPKKQAKKATETPHDPETGEVNDLPAETLPAVTRQDGNIILPGGQILKTKKVITRTLLRHGEGLTVAVKFKGAIHTGKEIKGSTMAAAEIAVVEELASGHEMDYIVNTVLKGILDENFPKDAYVGKSFAIYKAVKAKGKRYNTFEVVEVE